MTLTYYQVRPESDTDEGNWITVAAGSLPQVVDTLAAGTYEVRSLASSDWSAAVTVTAAATAPAAFTVGQWSVNSDGDVTISALPSDGGSAITDLEYRVNGGTAVSFAATTTGTYTTTATTADDLEIRAVNAIGAGAWSDVKAVPAAPAWATFDEGSSDGTFSTAGGYRIATLTANGNLVFSGAGEVEYLVQAGGGGMGTGGGGAGGWRKYVAGEANNTGAGPLEVLAQSYAVTVGAGGAGSAASDQAGSDGGNSTFAGLTATGGGGGARGTVAPNGRPGGCGGGAAAGVGTYTGGTGSQGGDGGAGPANTKGGGGGGLGGNGGAGLATGYGDGGDGLQSAITGTSLYYGGGGCSRNTELPADNDPGTPGLGWDRPGGGGVSNVTGSFTPLAGQAGVVIVRVAI